MSRRPFAVILGVIILLFGLVLFLQGIGTLPGSFMTGPQFWAIVGALMIIIGATVILASLRKPSSKAGTSD